jgi:hypothetical protein
VGHPVPTPSPGLLRPPHRHDGGESHIVFVVRNDRSRSDIYYQTSGHHLAGLQRLRRQQPLHRRPAERTPRAYKVSYNRPFTTRGVQRRQDWIFNARYPMIRWLERNGYDVSYETASTPTATAG